MDELERELLTVELRRGVPKYQNNLPLHLELKKPNCNIHRVREMITPDDLEKTDCEGNTALHYALFSPNCKLEVIRLLIENKVEIHEPNFHGDSSLHIAVKSPTAKLEVVEELLNYKPFLAGFNDERNTPLHCAVLNTNYKIPIITALINKGAKLNAINHYYEDVLQSALRNPNCSIDLVDALLESGANVNDRYKSFDTTVFKYILNPNLQCDILKKLLRCGADVSGNGRRGESILHYAFRRENCYDVFCTILENSNVNINSTNRKGSAILNTILNDPLVDERLVFLLLDHGAGLYIADKWDNLPLHKAVCSHEYNMKVVQMLLDKGACIYKLNSFGSSPLGIVMGKYKLKPEKHEYCIKLLLTYAVKSNFEDSEYNNESNFQGYNLDVTLCPDVNFKNFEHLSRYIDTCCRELVRMRTDSLDKEFSLFDFICNTKRIIRRIKLENILTILCYNSYPIYKCFIVPRLDKAELLAKLNEQTIFTIYKLKIKGISSDKKVILPPDCVNQIISHLGDEDILNLVLAYFDPIRYYLSKIESVKRINSELSSADNLKRYKM